MPERPSRFASSLFAFVASTLAPHRNPVTCVLAGLDRPLAVCTPSERIEGDIVIIRPDVEHRVEIHGRAKVLYFDGLEFPLTAALAARVPPELAALAVDALGSDAAAQAELRIRFSRGRARAPAVVARAIEAIVADPMLRMGQAELAHRLGVERTQAMRAFKLATGMTFRGLKRWTALCAATRRIAEGELVRTAAMDAGFADTAHLTRTFRATFGTTPTLATADRRSLHGALEPRTAPSRRPRGPRAPL
ncbi:helix-turn-helix transcriptional regulator [Sandaracinus amylolyticus]|uniref:helix-turn-helix transcriptional regulator n=1 Tax=Sandaracinus amylolyticus TaxID=927083 RepID=UPI001F3FE342|nr:AraC family transcriptional regulator [Sandaracinus amylolyticus]UJR84969.1 HssI [Sandaracinus amylolyticus]